MAGKFVKFQHCKLKTFINNQLTTVVPSSFLLGLFMLNKFLSSSRRFRCNFNISSTLILALARPTSTFEAKIGPKMGQKTRKTYTSLIFLLSEIHIFTRFLQFPLRSLSHQRANLQRPKFCSALVSKGSFTYIMPDSTCFEIKGGKIRKNAENQGEIREKSPN